jgi:pSer/pThr/pTyr-binding forkhead associated (FHA) protein
VEFNGTNQWLIDIPTPEDGFLVLETLPETRTESRSLHAISLENKVKLKLGRAHESDIRISDISVSRKHAAIRSKKNSLYLEDNSSKFGTLVRVKRPIVLEVNSSITLQ